MADPIMESAAQLRVGPPPDGYESGPVEVVYHPDDGREPKPIQTKDTLDDAIAFANDCVSRGYLAGELELRTPVAAPTALEQVQAEQAAYEAGTEDPDDPMHQVVDLDDAELGAIASSPDHPLQATADTELERRADQPLDEHDAETPKPKPNEELAPTHHVVFVGKRGGEKVDYKGPEDKARERFTVTPSPGVGRLELRTADGTVLDTKAPHLASVEPEPDCANSLAQSVDEPEASGSASTQVEETEEPAPEDVVEPDEGDVETAEINAAREGEGREPLAEGPEEETGQKTLIDRSQYDREDLALPMIDGQQVDRIAFAFTGSIMLDRSDPADVALWRKLTLGQDVTLQVEGSCAGYTGKSNTNRDGDLVVVVGVRRIKVHTIYLPAGEAA